MNVTRTLLFALFGVAIAVSAAAQSGVPQGGQRGAQPGAPQDGQRGGQTGGQSFKWWQDEKMKAELGLTAEQVARVEDVFQTSVPPQRKILEELGRREKEFSALLLKNDATEAEVLRQVALVESVRAELSKERTLMLFRMNRILTPEQRVKFNDMHDRRDRGRREPPPIKK